MARTQNKTQPHDADVAAFIDSVESDPRREDARVVLELMRKVTGEEPRMWGPTIVGFGVYQYKYESGREGEWFLVGFSPRKAKLVLYIMGGFLKQDELMAQLGKYKTGKACLYLNKLVDVDLKVLKKLVKASAAHVKKTSKGC